MKVCLVLPNIPIDQRTVDDVLHDPMSLLYLGTVLEKKHEIILIDAFGENLDMESIMKKIVLFAPDVVCISLMFECMKEQAESIVNRIRCDSPNVITIAGGPYATLASEELFEYLDLDFALMFEGEITLPKLISNLNIGKVDLVNSIPGLITRHDEGDILMNTRKLPIQDLDEIPIPNRKLIGNRKSKYVSILSSRGCGNHCFYCSTDKVWFSKWRGRSAKNVMSEVRYLVENNYLESSQTLTFIDDNFTKDHDRLIEFCNLMIEYDSKISWGCSSRPEDLNETYLDLMAKAGCEIIFLGVESGSRKVLEKMNRAYDKNYIISLSKQALSKGIIFKASFMIGLPFEDAEDVRETMDLIKKIHTFNTSIHVFTPRIGTPSYEKPESLGIRIHDASTFEMSDDCFGKVSTKYLTIDQINEYYNKALGLTRQKQKQKIKYLSLLERSRCV